MTPEEIIATDGLREEFAKLLSNDAFQFMERHFDNQSLRPLKGPIEEKGERFIADTAVKMVFREFYRFAKGPQIDPEINFNTSLEDEDEPDTDANSLLNE